MGAAMTGLPIVAISNDEADALAESVAELGKHYDLSFDGPGFAITSLVITAAMIYGPRVMVVRAQMRAAKAQRATAPANPLDIGDAPTSSTYDFSVMTAAGMPTQ